MKACNCTLPYINGPDACRGCSNWEEPQTNPYQQYPQTKSVKKITRTIDKYNSDGVLIGREVITDEYEDIERLEWNKPFYTIGEDTVINFTNVSWTN